METTQGRTFALSTASVTDALIESVRQRILEGAVRPGEKVTEGRLAAEYDVARPTARAAIERLASSGLLARSAYKAAIVPELTATDIVDIFIAREAVETKAVSLLAGARVTPAQALAAHDQLAGAVERGDFPSQVTMDMQFHRSLVADAGVARLARMHDVIMGEVELTMSQHLAHRATAPSAIVAEHAHILDAISQGDANAAQRAIQDHLLHAQDRLLERARRA